jgi:hypothetical protein
MTKSDRLTYAVLAILIALLIFALIIRDARSGRLQRHVDELESELADTREEKEMFQSTLRGLVEGETNFEPRISKED